MPVAFQPAVDYAILNECGGRIDGGLTRDPTDPGGTTKWGIAARSHPGIDIPNLSRADACAIYKEEYYDRLPGLQSLNAQRIATKIFDAAVHLGIRGGALCAQRAFNDMHAAGLPVLLEDGGFGLISAQQINSVAEADYLLAFVRRQADTYEKICAKHGGDYQRRYLTGFLNRARKLPS